MARERISFQGLPARICWVGLGLRAKLGLAFNEWCAARRAVGADRDRPQTTSTPARWPARTAKPSRCRTAWTPSDWPLLNALLNTASGATWVSLHHGAAAWAWAAALVQTVRDGTDEAAERIARVLHNDPATGVMRHADAGYSSTAR